MTRVSRRLFLQETLLAAAAAAPGSAWAAAEPTKQSASPNERLNMAIIGARIRGGQHVQVFGGRRDCAITHICDADSTVGEQLAAKIPNKPKFVQDMRRIFDDKSIDVVTICTPNHWHSLAAIWAMQAGKDVYVEKPVSHNIGEGRRMVQAARKYNRICQAGTQHRANGVHRAAARYVREGKLGRVTLAYSCVSGTRGSIGPAGQYSPPPTVDYDLWSGPAPMEIPVRRKSFHYDWHWFWNWGGGELANNSVHYVDTLRLITGLAGLGRGVLCLGARLGLDDCAETPNVQLAVHDFGPATLVQEIRNLKGRRPKHGSIYIAGTEGYLAGELGRLCAYDRQGNELLELSGPALDHFGSFLEAVRTRNREALSAEVEGGHVSTSLIHVANISHRLGRPASPKEIQEALEARKTHPYAMEMLEEICQYLRDRQIDLEKTPLALGPSIEIDSDRENFIGNPAANTLLTRDYRRPFVVPAENEL
ncbi:MAG: Gfo/Idh/MocA family oxidoreductase [Rhodopirellula sp.]|nr:Gfo/Idh/MocA family oxidoreductase [Rhodopirellula sp.]